MFAFQKARRVAWSWRPEIPREIQSGTEIKIDGEIDSEIYVAGARVEDGKLFTSGGRVLGVTCTADTEKAIEKTYKNVKR